jgi:hypothetical protein
VSNGPGREGAAGFALRMDIGARFAGRSVRAHKYPRERRRIKTGFRCPRQLLTVANPFCSIL